MQESACGVGSCVEQRRIACLNYLRLGFLIAMCYMTQVGSLPSMHNSIGGNDLLCKRVAMSLGTQEELSLVGLGQVHSDDMVAWRHMSIYQ
jgi:hypothetical protein